MKQRLDLVQLMKILQWALTGLVLLGLVGCIEFVEEEVRWRYLPQEDVLLMTLTYEGIHGGAGKRGSGKAAGEKPAAGDLKDQEIQQLEEVMGGGRAFFFNNWIFEFNRGYLEKALAEFGDADDLANAQLLDLVLKEAVLQNVGFFLDADGRLCGAQTMRIGNVGKLLELSSRVVADKLLAEIHKTLDGDQGSTGGSSKAVDRAALNPGVLLKRLERVKFERLRLAGITRLNGRYRINLVDPEAELNFWLEEERPSRGFSLVEVDFARGFARIRKNGQTAKVHLRSSLVVAEVVDEDQPSLESMQMWARAAEAKTQFAKVSPRGFSVRFPLTQEDFEKLKEKSGLPHGVSMTFADDLLELRMTQDGKMGGVLRKECFPGYAPNAVKHVRNTYGLRKRTEVEAELKRFLDGDRIIRK